MTAHRPLRDACSDYINARVMHDSEYHAERMRTDAALAAMLGCAPSVQTARAIRDAINAAWDAGYKAAQDDDWCK